MIQTRPITVHSKRALSLDGGRVIGTPTKSIAGEFNYESQYKKCSRPDGQAREKEKEESGEKDTGNYPAQSPVQLVNHSKNPGHPFEPILRSLLSRSILPSQQIPRSSIRPAAN